MHMYVISSLILKPNFKGPTCFELYYHMYGDAMGEFEIYFQDDGGQLVPKWSRSGDQKNKWHKASVNLYLQYNCKVKYYCHFETI